MPVYGPTPDQNDQYFSRKEQAELEFADLASDYKKGQITSDEYRKKMRDAIIDFLIDLAILAENEGLDEDGIDDLTGFTSSIFELLDQMIIFVRDTGEFSEDYLRWRASIFSNARQVFIRFTMPRDIWLDLPVHPGDDCLGDGACGCGWHIEVLDDGTVYATWTLGSTEHCTICLDHAAEYDPYVILPEF